MVYIHVPFCKSFCTYCDFYSEICSSKESEQVQKVYADCVCREIDARREEIARTEALKTLYIGGGTPSVLPLKLLEQMVNHLGDGRYDEFTIEVNPEDIVRKGEDYVKGLLELGMNRVSMGVQSFSDPLLKWMGRRHDSARALKAVEILRNAGVKNLSIDLIFGISIMSDEEWQNSVQRALELHPEHISAYQLSIEEGSALAQMAARGEYSECPEERCREQYDYLCRQLTEAGYNHYEVSNFALPGSEAVHNGAYWRRLPYVGLGPGAHSYDGARTRSWNSQELSGWQRQSETLSDEDCAVETVMLGLRTAEGLKEDSLRACCDSEALEKELSEGALQKIEGGRFRIPEDHFFVSDAILRELL